MLLKKDLDVQSMSTTSSQVMSQRMKPMLPEKLKQKSETLSNPSQKMNYPMLQSTLKKEKKKST
jgi:hypothetical protein